MAQKTYISLDKLRVYDEKLKTLIDTKDAAALKSAKDYADSLAKNYDAAGAAATALDNAKAYADGKDEAIAAAKKAGDDAAAAAGVADGKAVAAQEAVDNLSEYVGTIPEGATATNVVAYVQEKTSGIATSENLRELTERVAQAETDIDNIEKDYLKAADKTELEGKINGVQSAVDTEKERAMGIEGGLETRLKAVEDDYLKAADKTELQNNINTVSGAVERLTNGVSADEIDGVNDLIQYVKDHGTEVTGMQKNISDNADAISGVAGRVETLEGEMDDAQAAILLRAEKTYVDGKVEELQGVDSGLDSRIKTLEGKFGGAEGSIEDQIADAQAAAEATAAADATEKANQALADAKTYTNTEVGKDRTRLEALEAIEHHDHANKAELDLIAEGDKAKWDAAAAKAHEHGNKTVLDGITAENVTTWNTVTSKAAAADLTAVGDRVTALETWHNDFVEVSESEINQMFA